MTVLADCGLEDTAVQSFRKKGLRIGSTMLPVEHPMRSTGPDWWIYATDDFTPPLTDQERTLYISDAAALRRDLLANLDLFSELCDALIVALQAVPSLVSQEEQTAAHLAALRIFQSGMDYHYYRYDRHFDYQDYEQSPVGYHWKQLKQLCMMACQRNAVPNPETISHQAALYYLTRFEDEKPASKNYLLQLERFAGALTTKPSVDTYSSSAIAHVEIQLEQDPELKRDITRFAARFSQSSTDVIRNVLKFAAYDSHLANEDSAKPDGNLIVQLEHALTPEERNSLHQSVHAMIEYQLAQEEEPFKFYGLTAKGSGRVLDVGFKAWQALASITADAEQSPLINQGYLRDVIEIFDGNPMFGTRKLLHVGIEYYAQPVVQLYTQEIKRWITD